jgi:CBS domain-containing protein
MTPRPRYLALNQAVSSLRGGDYQFQLRGSDEINIVHDSVMLESCCTSFQIHFQADPERFALQYNTAQLITAPLLAAATNSALLFGRRLWHETRIPLFQQSVDTRSAAADLRERRARVSFGTGWMQASPVETFREDIARFPVLLDADLGESSEAILEAGGIPDLRALRIHNGTVYRWNRPCYGVAGGSAHLRIENRVLPSGPTILDEIANAAFFFGLMLALPGTYGNFTSRIDFGDAESNFLAAAQNGIDASFIWLDGRTVQARPLILEELLPLAQAGLRSAAIDGDDAARYLGLFEERVREGMTGSRWMLRSLRALKGRDGLDAQLRSLTASMHRLQCEDTPVSRWPLATIETNVGVHGMRIEEFMTTDLFTVQATEPIELILHLMNWRQIRHVPVEDEEGRLAGVVSPADVFRHLERSTGPAVARDVMNPSPPSVRPESSLREAIDLMSAAKADCLPVTRDGRLVGIVTERDILRITARLLEASPV